MQNKQFYDIKDLIKPNGLFPISRSSWLRGIDKGLYPAPIKHHPFGPKSIWSREDILKFLASVSTDQSLGDCDD